MSTFSGPFNRQTEMLDRIADAITGTDEFENPTGNRALDSLERLALWFEAHGGIPSSSGSESSNAVLYDTKANWDAKRSLVSERGTIYIYSDYQSTTNDNGDTVYVPGIKVGDGLAYLIDLPIANPATLDQLVEQIAARVAVQVADQIAADVVMNIREDLNATQSLVTPEDREKWDGKVQSAIDNDDPENLIFSF